MCEEPPHTWFPVCVTDDTALDCTGAIHATADVENAALGIGRRAVATSERNLFKKGVLRRRSTSAVTGHGVQQDLAGFDASYMDENEDVDDGSELESAPVSKVQAAQHNTPPRSVCFPWFLCASVVMPFLFVSPQQLGCSHPCSRVSQAMARRIIARRKHRLAAKQGADGQPPRVRAETAPVSSSDVADTVMTV